MSNREPQMQALLFGSTSMKCRDCRWRPINSRGPSCRLGPPWEVLVDQRVAKRRTLLITGQDVRLAPAHVIGVQRLETELQACEAVLAREKEMAVMSAMRI